MNRTGLQIERKTDMYGQCRTINAYRGNWNEFGGAAYSEVQKDWIVSLFDQNGTCHDFTVMETGSHEESMQHVEALIFLFYREHYPETQKVPARNLRAGDLTGSGETDDIMRAAIAQRELQAAE